MGLWDFLFGSDDVRKAMQDRSYLDPAKMSDPNVQEAASRMELSSRLGNAAQAVAAANQKGAGPGTLLAAFGGGFGTGGDDLLKRQYMAAQTKQAIGAAAKAEAEAKYYGGGSATGNRPLVIRHTDGRVMRWSKQGYKPVPRWEQEGYAGMKLPGMPADLDPGLNDDQRTIAPSSGGSGGGFYPKGTTYTDTSSGQRYVSDGTQWVKVP